MAISYLCAGVLRADYENGEARAFYASLEGPVRVGIEATGHTRWFERMRGEDPGGGKMRRGISSLPVL